MRLQRQRHGDPRAALIAVGEFADQPVGLVSSDTVERSSTADELRLMERLIQGFQPMAPGDLGGDADVLEHGSWGKISVIWNVRAMPSVTR